MFVNLVAVLIFGHLDMAGMPICNQCDEIFSFSIDIQ